MTGPAVGYRPQAYARIAGCLYLIVIVGGLFAEVFVRQQMIVYGDVETTALNILAHETLYRLGFAISIVYLACNVPLALIFYVLFKRVDANLSLLMAFFILAGTAIETANLLNHYAPLILLGGGSASSAFTTEQLQSLAYMSLRLFAAGFSVSLVFFAFYDFIIGYLIYRSTFLPRILGVLMVIAGLCYLTHSLVTFVAPAIAGYLFPYILLPCLLAEASVCLWLIAMGVDVRRWERPPSISPSLESAA